MSPPMPMVGGGTPPPSEFAFLGSLRAPFYHSQAQLVVLLDHRRQFKGQKPARFDQHPAIHHREPGLGWGAGNQGRHRVTQAAGVGQVIDPKRHKIGGFTRRQDPNIVPA